MWSIQPTLNPAGAAGSNLDGASCTSPMVCTAVGESKKSVDTTLAERYSE